MAGLLAAAALALTSVTTGLALRCGMPRHCAACPVETGPSLLAAGCPMMSPAAPRVGATQAAFAPLSFDVAITTAPATIDPLPAPASARAPLPDGDAPPGSPPVPLVLRV